MSPVEAGVAEVDQQVAAEDHVVHGPTRAAPRGAPGWPRRNARPCGAGRAAASGRPPRGSSAAARLVVAGAQRALLVQPFARLGDAVRVEVAGVDLPRRCPVSSKPGILQRDHDRVGLLARGAAGRQDPERPPLELGPPLGHQPTGQQLEVMGLAEEVGLVVGEPAAEPGQLGLAARDGSGGSGNTSAASPGGGARSRGCSRVCRISPRTPSKVRPNRSSIRSVTSFHSAGSTRLMPSAAPASRARTGRPADRATAARSAPPPARRRAPG